MLPSRARIRNPRQRAPSAGSVRFGTEVAGLGLVQVEHQPRRPRPGDTRVRHVVAMGQLRHARSSGLHADTVGDRGRIRASDSLRDGLLPRLPRDEPTQGDGCAARASRRAGSARTTAAQPVTHRGPIPNLPTSRCTVSTAPRNSTGARIPVWWSSVVHNASRELKNRSARIGSEISACASEVPGTPSWHRRSTAACRSSSPGSGTRAPCRSGPEHGPTAPDRFGPSESYVQYDERPRHRERRDHPRRGDEVAADPHRGEHRGQQELPGAAARSRRPSGRARPCPRARAAHGARPDARDVRAPVRAHR